MTAHPRSEDHFSHPSLEIESRARVLLWNAAGVLAALATASLFVGFARGNRYLAMSAMVLFLASLSCVVWRSLTSLLNLLKAPAPGNTLAIAFSVDSGLKDLMARAHDEMRRSVQSSRPAVLQAWERKFQSRACTGPPIARLAARLAGSAAATFLTLLFLLAGMSFSLAASNCSNGVCEAVYDHSCLPAGSTGIGAFITTSIHFLYYQVAGLFNITGEMHRPLTRIAQILSVATSLTWILFIVGILGGSWSALLLLYSSLTPEALTQRARAELIGELPEPKAQSYGASSL